MTNKKFVNVYNNAIRESEIACITAPCTSGRKVNLQNKTATFYEVRIILASGYTITVENSDMKQLNRTIADLLKKITE